MSNVEMNEVKAAEAYYWLPFNYFKLFQFVLECYLESGRFGRVHDWGSDDLKLAYSYTESSSGHKVIY